MCILGWNYIGANAKAKAKILFDLCRYSSPPNVNTQLRNLCIHFKRYRFRFRVRSNIIPPLCMFEGLREHNFVDFLQLKAKKSKLAAAEVEAMKSNIESLRKDLESKMVELLEKRLELNTNLKERVIEIEHLKEEKIIEVTQIISELYNEMAQGLRFQTEKDLRSIQMDVETIDEHVLELINIREHLEGNSAEYSRKRLKDVLTSLKLQGGERYYKKLVLGTKNADIEKTKMLCDIMLERNLKVNLTETLETHLLTSVLEISSKGESCQISIRNGS